MSNNEIIALWSTPNGVIIPEDDAINPRSVIEYAISLKPIERERVKDAFNAKLYDMATEYVWKRTISRLKSMILDFGIEFVFEMLGRSLPGIGNPEEMLTEVDIINLAKELGFINKDAQMIFLQHSELLNYLASPEAQTTIDYPKALSYTFDCTKYVLGYNVEMRIEFTSFRERLYKESLVEDDKLLEDLELSPYFHKSTTVRTLINLIKTKDGGELDNSVHNFSIIIPKIWESLMGEDKYFIGNTYSEEVNAGHKKQSSYIKNALTKVRGFNYVPENLRSNTFIEAANELKKVHFAFYNFYNEPEAAKKLERLGTIPSPAFGKCISAVLVCKIGNSYGVSADAQPSLNRILTTIPDVRWAYYFNEVLPTDSDILYKVYNSSTFDRWVSFIKEYDIINKDITNTKVRILLNASIQNDRKKVLKIVGEFLEGNFKSN